MATNQILYIFYVIICFFAFAGIWRILQLIVGLIPETSEQIQSQ